MKTNAPYTSLAEILKRKIKTKNPVTRSVCRDIIHNRIEDYLKRLNGKA